MFTLSHHILLKIQFATPIIRMMKTIPIIFSQYDHLGSIRVVADVSGSVVQKKPFLPFPGCLLPTTRIGNSAYKFNGKELDLSWIELV